MPVTIIVRNKPSDVRNSTVHVHPTGVNQSMRGRAGATVIFPGVSLMNGAELRDHVDLVNGRNPGHEKITVADVEKAIAQKAKKAEQPQTVREMLDRGWTPPGREKMSTKKK